MMNPSTYKKVAVASTFSPRFEQVLSEAGRIRERFGADLSLIYIGERDDETARKFQNILRRLQLPGDSPVYYGQGDPADGILRAIVDNDVDLIVAGALEKQSALHPFLGNVARRLLREASCSVLLFTNPELKPKPLRRIVFVANYSDHAQRAFQQTLKLALAESCERLYAIRVYTSFDEARATLDPDPRKEALRLCLAELQDGARQIVSLRYDEGLDPAAIAARMGRSRAAVNSLLQRIREILKECVDRRLTPVRG